MAIADLVQERLRIHFNNPELLFDKSIFVGGLTNYNYLMEIDGQSYVIREPGGLTDRIVDRFAENKNNFLASEIGLNSECVYFDADTGIKFSRFISNSENIGNLNPNSKANIDGVIATLKKLHYSKISFDNVFDVRKELSKYEDIVMDIKGSFFIDYFDLKDELYALMDKGVTYNNLLPCHNDTVPENFILDNLGTMYLIDWEYSGMNDTAWDIAAYILESRLDDKGIDLVLKGYYGASIDEKIISNIKHFMLAQDLLWSVRALIRHYNSDDFLEYCYLRYGRFKRNIDELRSKRNPKISNMVLF